MLSLHGTIMDGGWKNWIVSPTIQSPTGRSNPKLTPWNKFMVTPHSFPSGPTNHHVFFSLCKSEHFRCLIKRNDMPFVRDRWLGDFIQHSTFKVHYVMGCFWILLKLNNIGKVWKYSIMLYTTLLYPLIHSGHWAVFSCWTLCVMVLWTLLYLFESLIPVLSGICLEVEALLADAVWNERAVPVINMSFSKMLASLDWIRWKTSSSCCISEFPKS